jgi:serine beta-lactamase-like protein LACTB, mitochondrial
MARGAKNGWLGVRRPVVLVGLMMLTLPKLVNAQQQDSLAQWQTWIGRDYRMAAAIRSAVDEVSIQQRNIGLAVAVWHRGRVVFAAGQGFADLEQSVPVSRETRFQVASVTKAFTGLVLLKLVEAGRIDLDAPIQRYVPTFPQKPGEPITLRLLQAHLGGIRGYRPGERTTSFFDRHFDRAMDATVVFAQDSLGAPPGTRPIYSSYGYNLIAAAIEGATGRRYTEILATDIIGPLGLARTAPPDARVPIRHRSRSYTYRAPNNPSVETDTVFRGRDFDFSYNAGGGNLLTTAEDLVRFGSGLLAPGFLKPEMRTLLLTPFRADAIQNFGWVMIQDSSSRRVLFTTGDIEAFQAGVAIWPEQDLVVAITSNTNGIGAQAPVLRRDVPQRIGRIILAP